MKITDLHVKNFKSISEIELNDIGGFNVVVGYNGYGKTNFLTAVYLLLRNISSGIDKKSIEDRNNELLLLWKGYDTSSEMKLGGRIEFTSEEANKILGKNAPIILEVENEVKYSGGYAEWSVNRLVINGSPPGKDDIQMLKKIGDYASQHVEYVPIFDQTYFDETMKRMMDMNSSPINLRRYWYDFVNLVSKTIPEIKGMEFWEGRKLVLNVYDMPIYIDWAASGFQRVLLMLFIIWLSGNKILLVEEPEINMHPTLQSKIMKLMKNWTDSGILQAFVTTHSPYIVSSNVDSYIVLRRNQGSSTAVLVKPKEGLRNMLSILKVDLSDIVFNRIVILTDENSEPVVVGNWLRRLDIIPEDNGIKIFKVSSGIELDNWLKLRKMLKLDTIFLGMCDSIDVSLREFCVPMSREVESYYNKQVLLNVLKNVGISPDDKELKELGKEENMKWLYNLMKKRGMDYNQLRMSIGEMISQVDTVEIPKEIEILANKIKSIQAVN